jgi:hypothetical protein
VSAKEYQKTLKDFFSFENARIPRFDLIFLGMGVDGHIASLFTGQKSLYEKEKLVIAVKGGNPKFEPDHHDPPIAKSSASNCFYNYRRREIKDCSKSFRG